MSRLRGWFAARNGWQLPPLRLVTCRRGAMEFCASLLEDRVDVKAWRTLCQRMPDTPRA